MKATQLTTIIIIAIFAGSCSEIKFENPAQKLNSIEVAEANYEKTELPTNLGAISGKVVDMNTLRPISCAVIFLEEKKKNIFCEPPDGLFEQVLPPGEYTIRIESFIYVPRYFRFKIEAGKKTIFTVELYREAPAGGFRGHILNEAKQPIAGEITYAKDPTTSYAGLYLRSNPLTGEFPDDRGTKILERGVYAIKVSADGYETKFYKIPIEVGHVTILEFELKSVPMEGAIDGRVIGCNGKPLSARIDFGVPNIATIKTDLNGRFFQKLKPGNYTLTISAKKQLRKFKVPVADNKATTNDFKLCGNK